MDTVRTRSSRDIRESEVKSVGAPSRIVARVMLLIAFAVATVTLTQCQMVGDQLNGVKAGVFSRRSDCIKVCTRAHQDAIKAESDRHSSAVGACNGNPECIQAEQDRHQGAIDVIQKAFRDCINGCHNQGGGN